MKPLNSGHLRAFKYLSVTERCPLMESNLTKIVIFRLNNLSAIQSMSTIYDVRQGEVSLSLQSERVTSSHLSTPNEK